jgi:hypothetical protein
MQAANIGNAPDLLDRANCLVLITVLLTLLEEPSRKGDRLYVNHR